MKSILSIQSHVVFGYVGNKTATYALQSMGYDVWPVHTVQFSNHTGYGQWQGAVFDAEHILKLVEGLFNIKQDNRCVAILSGYMGSASICEAVYATVQKFKSCHPNIVYLCDPVIAKQNCVVKAEVFDFFKEHLFADIITPSQKEAEQLSGMAIRSPRDLANVADMFHARGIKIVVITALTFQHHEGLYACVSEADHKWMIHTPEHVLNAPVNGAGDLFSSVFLGAYLKDKNAVRALQIAVFYLEKVLRYTQTAGERELQVLSVRYDDPDDGLLPQVSALDAISCR